MINFRRWLRLGSPQLIVVSAVVVGNASGCHSLSEYLTDADAVSSHSSLGDWQAAQPLSAPYDSSPLPLSAPLPVSPSGHALPPQDSAEADAVPPPSEQSEAEFSASSADSDGSGLLKRAPQPDTTSLVAVPVEVGSSVELPMPGEALQSVVVETPALSDPLASPAATDAAGRSPAEPKRAVAVVPTASDEPFGSNLFPESGPLTDLSSASPLEEKPVATTQSDVPSDDSADEAAAADVTDTVTGTPNVTPNEPPFAGPSEVAVPEPVGTPGDAVRAPSLPTEVGDDLQE